MKNKLLALALIFVVQLPAQTQNATLKTQNWVNPFIGTDAHGHTFPGATMPFGMVQLSPDTRPDPNDWDGCSGYHFSDSVIYGFSHTHLSGTGVSDYCDILLQPVSTNSSFEKADFASPFLKKNERAEPGFYEVYLEKPNVQVELTASERVGFHRYKVNPKQWNLDILLDLKWRDVLLDAEMDTSRMGEGIVTGHRFSSSWAKDQRIFFFLKFSKIPSSVRINERKQAIFDFNWKSNNLHEVLVECAISSVDVAGAENNWKAETTHFNFEKARQNAQNIWQKQLSAIEIEDGTPRERTVFYTALYHTMLAPNVFSDVDGRYRGHDQQIHLEKNHKIYTVFSLWDTYRALHPLMTILEPARVTDWMVTFLRNFEQGGRLPVWELAANETNCMIGNHSIPVIADAYLKGLVPDSLVWPLSLAIKKTLSDDEQGLKNYRTLGYIPSDLESESVSKTIEHAFDFYAANEMNASIGLNYFLKTCGKTDLSPAEKDTTALLKTDFNYFDRHKKNWINLLDPITGFFRAKSNSSWTSNFDPYEVNFNFTEGNAWHYSFLQSPDFLNQIYLSGGRDEMVARLDSLFETKKPTTGRIQADITGLIGQYAQGNEPSHHIPYLYNVLGKPEKTTKIVHQILKDFFTEMPDGIPGNDDCGQMSAWVVMSMLGFYQITPVGHQYEMTVPSFKSWKIKHKNGQTTRVSGVNPEKMTTLFISPTLLKLPMHGRNLTNENFWGKSHVAKMVSPDSAAQMADIVWGEFSGDQNGFSQFPPVPFLKNSERVFTHSQTLEIANLDQSAQIHFTLDGSEPTELSTIYNTTVLIEKSTILKAIAIKNGEKSAIMSAEFTHQADRSKWKIIQKNGFNNQYTGRGERGLMDGLRGGLDFRSGGWQGFEGKNMVATLDFGEIKSLRKLAIGFMQDENSWIFLPKKVAFEVSADGENWLLVGEKMADHLPADSGLILQDFTIDFSEKSTRFVRISAESLGKCPAFHKGAGSDSWIFSDEILVE
jgi:predicted alpha-1,2-mannosidase